LIANKEISLTKEAVSMLMSSIEIVGLIQQLLVAAANELRDLHKSKPSEFAALELNTKLVEEICSVAQQLFHKPVVAPYVASLGLF